MPAPVKIFVMGRNVWQEEWEWPPNRVAERSLFLQPGRKLSMEAPNMDEGFEALTFDWDNPVPTLGGNHSIGPYNPGLFDLVKPGPFDQASLEARDDVISFTTSRLKKDLEVIGDIRITLFISSDAIDVDWFAKVVDVHPNGKAFNVTEGCLRASYRNGSARRHFLTPGAITRLDFELGATAMCFKAGHAIRLDICNSNFPLFELNCTPLQRQGKKATNQKIHFGNRHPSHIILPVSSE